jgi:hypothetical protein
MLIVTSSEILLSRLAIMFLVVGDNVSNSHTLVGDQSIPSLGAYMPYYKALSNLSFSTTTQNLFTTSFTLSVASPFVCSILSQFLIQLLRVFI